MKILKLILSAFFLGILFVPAVSAAPRYPIRDLDGCRDAKECSLYCEVPQNMPACWSYAKHILHGNVLGETTVADTATAELKKITFPVEELGNCKTITECRKYCSDTENHSLCSEFALKQKLIKPKYRTLTSAVLNAARKELGCTSTASCYQFCLLDENRETCQAFGTKNNLVKKTVIKTSSIAPEVFAKTRQELGCTNETSCRNVCNHPDNREKCGLFARKYPIRSSAKKTATASADLGCTTEEECRKMCEENPDACPGFPQKEIPSFDRLPTKAAGTVVETEEDGSRL